MQATAVTQAAAGTPAKSYSKDDALTTRNSKNESKNRAANTVGVLAKLVKLATACKKANNSMDTINIRDGSSSSGEASNIHQGRQHQQQGLTTRTLATVGRIAAETMETSQMSPGEKRAVTAWIPNSTVEMPTTVLASPGVPTATEVPETTWTPTAYDVGG